MTDHLHSWTCKGCTNVCWQLYHGEVYKYCRAIVEGTHNTEWVTDTFIDCLNKTTDPSATDNIVRIGGTK